MSMINSNDAFGNRTRELPACSPVPQPTAPSRAPSFSTTRVRNLCVSVSNKCDKCVINNIKVDRASYYVKRHCYVLMYYKYRIPFLGPEFGRISFVIK